MARVENIIFRIQTDLSDVQKDTKKVRQEVAKTQKTVGSLKSGFAALGGAILASLSVGAVVSFGKELFKVAKTLELTAAKAATVFGKSLSDVTKAAKDQARQLGITTAEYIALAASVGDLLVPMGFQRKLAAELSVGLVKLSGALSEWSGGQITAAEATRIMTKATLGERDGLVALGIKISETDVKNRLLEKGQEKLTGTTLKQARATATLELIYEQTADAQRLYELKQNSLDRQSKIFTATLQEQKDQLALELTPAYRDLLVTLNDVLPKAINFGKALDATSRAIGSTIVNTLEFLRILPDLGGELSEIERILTRNERETLFRQELLDEKERAKLERERLARLEEERKAREAAAAAKVAADKAERERLAAAREAFEEGKIQIEDIRALEQQVEADRIQRAEDFKKQFPDGLISSQLFGDDAELRTGIDNSLEKVTLTIGEWLEDNKEAIAQFATFALEQFKLISDRRIEDLDREVDAQESRLDRALEITKDFNDETVQAEQERLDALLSERQKAVERQRALDAIAFTANSAVALSEALKGPFQIPQFFTVLALLAGIGAQVASISSSAGFAEGGYTGDGAKHDPKGIVHGGEFVFTKEKTAKHRDLFEAIHAGKPINWDGIGNALTIQGSQNDKEMKQSLDKIERAILGQESMYVNIDSKGIRILTKRLESKEAKIRKYAN